MKQCNKCKHEKELKEFTKKKSSKDGYHGYCKSCSREIVRKSYRNNKKYYVDKAKVAKDEIKTFIRELKETTPCSDCKVKYPYYVMDFDHLKDKTFNVSTCLKGKIQILNEIDKCEVVCSNCHRIRTHKKRKILMGV